MKKNLFLFAVILFYYCPVFSQTLYTSTIESGPTYNPGLGASNTPVIFFDDVDIPASQVQGTDSIRIKKVNFGIFRNASAPATTINLYYTGKDDTATIYANFINIPPIYIGSVNLPANGATATNYIASFGDSINTLFTLKTDTGNIYNDFQTFFLGLSFSNPDVNNGWLLTTPGAPASLNSDAIWVYDVDNNPSRLVGSFNGNPPATFYLEVFGGGYNVLPVTLSQFSAIRSGKVNILNWSTAQELNTSYFIIERSTNGTDYSPLAKVAAAGNSSMSHNYSFTDAAPVNGINYYRLQMVDKDNASKYSLIRHIRNAGLSDISIYPNPVKNNLTVTINADNAAQGQMMISDMNGKIVFARSISVAKGNNLLPVNTSKMAGGAYIIKINVNNDPVILKFNKE